MDTAVMIKTARDRGAAAAWGASGIVVLGFAWHAMSVWIVNSPQLLPTPTDTVAALVEYSQSIALWVAVKATVLQWAAGMALSCVVGIPAGIALGRAPVVAAYTMGTVNFLRTLPSVALLPLFVLVLGSGVPMLALLSFSGAVWLIIIPAASGAAHVDAAAVDTARVYRFGRLRTLAEVILPASMPLIATGLRYAASATLLIVVAAQIIVGAPGIGSMITRAGLSNETAAVYALSIAAGVIGFALNLVVRALVSKSLRWHPSATQGSAT